MKAKVRYCWGGQQKAERSSFSPATVISSARQLWGRGRCQVPGEGSENRVTPFGHICFQRGNAWKGCLELRPYSSLPGSGAGLISFLDLRGIPCDTGRWGDGGILTRGRTCLGG